MSYCCQLLNKINFFGSSCHRGDNANVMPRPLVRSLQNSITNDRNLKPPPIFLNPYNAEVISLSNHSLGRLRENYRTWQTVDKIVTRRLKQLHANGQFRRIQLNSERHTLIHGFDNAIIAYQVSAPTFMSAIFT